jgi:pimeloyl-ACP methyl ester carboxylesterase
MAAGQDEVEPFRIHVAQDVLDDLAWRLDHARFPHDFANEDWSYGVNGDYLRTLVDYWRRDYDWRAQEGLINLFSHYRTTIDDVPVHFIRQPGKGPNPIPIILSHGWPWTFWDFKDVILPLANPAAFGGDPADAFEVIVPSLPGFGFSTPVTKTGVNFTSTADLWRRLMVDVLGFDRFAAQGGDWGTLVTTALAHKYPEHVIGMHTTMVAPLTVYSVERPWDITGGVPVPAELPAAEREAIFAWQKRIASHVAVHMLDAQTLSYALHDSPVGLLAWLIKGRRSWGDTRGDIESRFDKDFLITTAMIYWITDSFVTSARYYAEAGREQWRPTHPGTPVRVPAGISVMPRDGTHGPFTSGDPGEVFENIVYQVVNEDGGHFSPLEVPETIVRDIRATFCGLR